MGNRKKRIGLVVGNYHTDHPSRLVHTIWKLLEDKDMELQVFLGTESASFMKDFTMQASQFDYQYASLCGYTQYEELDLLIISAGTLSIYQNSISLNEFLRHTPDNIPKILMETDQVQGDGISLIADNTEGLASCVEHLISVHGLTKIGFITGPKNNRDAEERFDGYRETLLKHGIPIREEYIALGDYSENIDRSVEELLDRAPDLEAIASANDEMTVAVYRVCAKRGLAVGRDIAVTGFDDMLMAQYMDPPLTTARQDYDIFAYTAVDEAMKIFRGEEVSSQRIPVPFIRRCSCGCSPDQMEQEQHVQPEREELIKSMQRSREYQHNSWMGSLMNREMLLEVGDPKNFYASIGSFMAYLGTAASYLCLFERPIRVKPGTIPEFPDEIYVCMRQEGKEYKGYDWDEAPKMYRSRHGDLSEFCLPGNFMTFLLFDGKYQYGVLNAAVDPEKIDFYYMLSLDIGTNLRYMEMWSQQKMYRAELQEMATTDSLTGLNNRAGVVHERERMIGKMTRNAGVIMADLDHLKQINDHFGHQEGDSALKAVADILNRVIGDTALGSEKKPDPAGQESAGQDKARDLVRQVIGRIGGDEYISCSTGISEDELKEQVLQIKKECAKYNEASGKPYYVEVSAGIATGRVRSMEDWAVLSKRADEELYEAKKSRRDFVIKQCCQEG